MDGGVQETVGIELVKQAVEAASDAIVITTPELDGPGPRLTYVNPAFERLTGLTANEVIGKSLAACPGMSPEPGILDQMRRELREKGKFTGRTTGRRNDGSELVVEWSVSPLQQNGETTHWVAIQRDVTDRVAQEAELKRLNEILERRVEARTEALQAANKELESFLYTVSHDFRGPLRAIMSSAMILIEDYGDKIDAEGQAELKRQSNAAKKLSNLMEELLRLSRLGRQEMNLQDLDLTVVSEEVGREVNARHGGNAVIEVEPGLRAKADERLARLLLQNLLDNSVKFAKVGEAARIQIGRTDRGAFFVRDRGIGFEPEQAERIFLPFERLHREDEYPGTGVGLTNVNRIAQKHGGKAWAEGRKEEGATFFFTLPDEPL